MTFEAGIIANRKDLFGHAMMLYRNKTDAEDLVSETILRALENRAKFDGKNLPGWLHTILFNTFCITRRKASNKRELPTADFSWDERVDQSNPEKQLLIKQDLAKLSVLPPQFREVLISVAVTTPLGKSPRVFKGDYIHSRDNSRREAAKSLGIPLATYKTRLYRARLRFAELTNA